MGCTSYQEMIALDAGGDLAAADAGRLAAHLRACDACRRFAVGLREGQRAVGLLAGAPVDAGDLAAVRDRVLREIERRRRPALLQFFRVPPRRLALAAGLLASLAAALLLRSGWRGPPSPEGPEPAPQVASRPSAPALEAAATPEPAAAPEPADGPKPPSSPETELGAPASRRHLEAPIAAEPAAALAANRPPIEPMVIKLVSEEADLVIYWLVDPSTEPKKETKHETSAV